jgi:hypothetical protein
MGWRFRKSLGFGPLLRLNLSKTGTSWSVGKPGLTVNVGRGRAKATASVPGTGLSYSQSTRIDHEQAPPSIQPRPDEAGGRSTGLMAKLFGGDIEVFRAISKRLKRGER